MLNVSTDSGISSTTFIPMLNEKRACSKYVMQRDHPTYTIKNGHKIPPF
jgi:hypothetical protein